MSYATLILGTSGSGKTASLRNFDPEKMLLIQPIRKSLPFPSKGWKEVSKDGGNILVVSNPAQIISAMKKTKREVIVIDDFQYILALMFMNRRNERGFDKFSDIGGAGFDICQTASELPMNKRVYILGHTETDEMGNTKIKTIGRLLDEKIVLEGMFTIVLRTNVESGNYQFQTQTNGSDTTKSPMGMFETQFIENDLNAVDERIKSYYQIETE